MSSHWIWYPTLLSDPPPRMTLFMTWREGTYLADGSDTFVQAVLTEVGVLGAIRMWRFQRYRACYFSPDLDETDWDDLWPFAWKLDVKFAARPTALDELPEGRRETGVSDDTWSVTNDPMHVTSSPCLVLGDFPDIVALRKAARAIEAVTPGARLSEAIAFARFPQLHVDLGSRDDAWYQAGAAEAQRVRQIMLDHDASTFFEHTLTRRYGLAG
jgi:hypothetical protein